MSLYLRSEFEEQLKSEQENKGEVSAKLKQLQERYTQEQKRMEEDQQEKQEIIQELSQQLEVHQQNFDILKRELNQVQYVDLRPLIPRG